MKNKKKNPTAILPNSSIPPQPQLYHFVPSPIPFYPPPPHPPWTLYPGVWQIPTHAPPPPTTAAVTAGVPIPQLPPFGLWPPPAVFSVMGPIMPTSGAQCSVMPLTNREEESVVPPTSVQELVASPPIVAEMPVVTALPDNLPQQPPPLRRRRVTRHSSAHERAVDAPLGDSQKLDGAATGANKLLKIRGGRSKKHNHVGQKASADHDKLEADIFDEQKSLRQDVSTVEISEGKENTSPLPKLGSEPFIGLRFSCEDEAYEFYNAYAKEKGFSIRKSHIQRSRVDRSVISREYVCASQGIRSANDRRYKGKVVRPRRETRVDCKAVMSIKRRSGNWIVDRFHKDHNHGLVGPVKAEKLRSHRKITHTTKSVIDTLYKCRIGPSKIIDVLAKAASEEDKAEIGGIELINYVKKGQKNNIGADCYQVLEYLQGRQASEHGFFYAIEAGENRSMRSIFWADSRARTAYKEFGDVMVFDSPCRTNKSLFPFTCFTGVNHHKQVVLFGCGFLADETVESFTWFFETFLRAMSHKYPTSVITSRDKAMMIAIEKVFPKTRQRFCMLEVEKSFLGNMSTILDTHPDFEAEYRKCVSGTRNLQEFESDWKALLLKYNLKDNSWLSGMYDLRQHWIPSYLQGIFFAGMTTTHLGDGMNYFEGFLHKKTDLDEFIPQYEQAVKQRRDEEADEDIMTMYTSAGSTSNSPIEEQAARVFTRSMFTQFRREFCESSGCLARQVSEVETLSKYTVGKIGESDDGMNVVIFDSLDKSVTCSCHMFESEGMLCQHALKVLEEVNVVEIPPKYILKRWTMSARYMGSCNGEGGDSSQDPAAFNVSDLKSTAIKFIELGTASAERLNCAFNIILEGMERVSLTSAPLADPLTKILACSSSHGQKIDDTTLHVNDVTLLVSPQVEIKDHTASSKVKLGIKQVQRKKRKCSACKQTGHYTSTCPQGSVIQSEISSNVTRSSRSALDAHTVAGKC